MNAAGTKSASPPDACAITETHLLLLPDGRVLVHNLTPAMAQVLQRLDPQNTFIQKRSFPAVPAPKDCPR
jgi:hypothetical protein